MSRVNSGFVREGLMSQMPLFSGLWRLSGGQWIDKVAKKQNPVG